MSLLKWEVSKEIKAVGIDGSKQRGDEEVSREVMGK